MRTWLRTCAQPNAHTIHNMHALRRRSGWPPNSSSSRSQPASQQQQHQSASQTCARACVRGTMFAKQLETPKMSANKVLQVYYFLASRHTTTSSRLPLHTARRPTAAAAKLRHATGDRATHSESADSEKARARARDIMAISWHNHAPHPSPSVVRRTFVIRYNRTTYYYQLHAAHTRKHAHAHARNAQRV